jgi:hypothetical protein
VLNYLSTGTTLHLSFRSVWLLDGVWVGKIGFIDHLYTQLLTTSNYSGIDDLHILQLTVTQTLVFSVSLIVPWQRIYNGLTVTTTHMKSSSHSLIPFLPSLLNHLRLPTLSILILAAWDPRYIASGRTPEKTPFPNNFSVVTEVCLPRRCIETVVLWLLLAYSLPRECVYRAVA